MFRKINLLEKMGKIQTTRARKEIYFQVQLKSKTMISNPRQIPLNLQVAIPILVVIRI
jgi:hypothetical protein